MEARRDGTKYLEDYFHLLRASQFRHRVTAKNSAALSKPR
jgi:hypothetical protein